jgi:hypothetical protein
MKPDYGLRLLQDGVASNVDLVFYDFTVFSITVLGHGQYSALPRSRTTESGSLCPSISIVDTLKPSCQRHPEPFAMRFSGSSLLIR